jgi:deoxyribonuclease-4
VLCLEGTAGAGSSIGGPFEHLRDTRAAILQHTSEPHRVGFCLDTCHLHVAGHDMSTKLSAQHVLARFDELCGLQHLRAWHLNDSKGALASHLDRHEHIGLGFVGGDRKDPKTPAALDCVRLANSGFAQIMQEPRFARVPKIMETPKEEGTNLAKIPVADRLDSINARRLRDLSTLQHSQ